MRLLHFVACAGSLLAGIAGVARAGDSSTDPAAYKQKLHGCLTQMKTDHPDMNHDARRKACRKELGSMPKAPKATSAPPVTSP